MVDQAPFWLGFLAGALWLLAPVLAMRGDDGARATPDGVREH